LVAALVSILDPDHRCRQEKVVAVCWSKAVEPLRVFRIPLPLPGKLHPVTSPLPLSTPPTPELV
jgi:hypothetical protein